MAQSSSLVWISALLTVSLMAAPVNPVSADHEEEPDFRWEVPQDFEGDLFIQITYEPTQPTWCRRTSSYASEPDDSNPVFRWVQESGGYGAVMRSGQDQVHVEGLEIDTRENRAGKAAGRGSAYSFVDSPSTWTIAVASLKHWENSVTGNTVFSVEIICDEGDVQVELAGSGELVTFRHFSMQGTGATVQQATVQVKDRVENNFSSDYVTTFISTGGFGTGGAGLIVHDHPTGTDHYAAGVPTGIPLSTRIQKTDEGGYHHLEVTRARASVNSDGFFGLMGGLSSLDSLDELL